MIDERGPYRPRRVRRNPIPQLPRYFKTVLWRDLKEKMEKLSHICFIIVQNGEVNNVFIKTIQKDADVRGPVSQRTDQPNEAVPGPVPGGQELEDKEGDFKTEEALHKDLEEPEEEIPEEVSELPPETPSIAPNSPAEASNLPDVAQTPQEAPETENTDSGTEVKPGHRVKAIYENQEVKGAIEKVLREAGRPDEFVTILDSGRKVILTENDLISLLVTEKR